MCGILGIYLHDENSNAYSYILDGLQVLQHRGQDSAGIYTCKKDFFYSHKNNGKVSEAFDKNIDYSTRLLGNMGIGHVRYATTGSLHVEQCQPLYTNSPFGLALVHNGNITNIDSSLISISNKLGLNNDGLYLSSGDAYLNNRLFVGSDVSINGNLFVNKDLTLSIATSVKVIMF
jgi:amidophosphoribosyltransferase